MGTRVSWASRALTILLLAGCRDQAGEPSAIEPEEGVCYIEYKRGFWCDDGQVDAGTWEVMCMEIDAEECNSSSEFASGVEYFSGCEWETKWERHRWMSEDECARLQDIGLLLPNGAECAYHQDCQSGCCGADGCSPCEPEPEPEPSFNEDNPAACSDGIDNDGDGYTDCGDGNCCDEVDCWAEPDSYCAQQAG